MAFLRYESNLILIYLLKGNTVPPISSLLTFKNVPKHVMSDIEETSTVLRRATPKLREEYEKCASMGYAPFLTGNGSFFPLPGGDSLITLTNDQCMVVHTSDGRITNSISLFSEEILGSSDQQLAITASVMSPKIFSSSPFSKNDIGTSGPISLLCIAVNDGHIRMYTICSGKCSLAREWIGSKRTSIRELGFSSDGMFLVSCCADGSAKVWNLRSNAVISTMPPRPGRLTSVSFIDISMDQESTEQPRLLAFGSESGEVIFWDTEKHRSTQIINLSSHRIITTEYLKASRSLVAASADQTIFCLKSTQTDSSTSFVIHDKFLVKEPISDICFLEKSAKITLQSTIADSSLPEDGNLQDCVIAVIAFTSNSVASYDISHIVYGGSSKTERIRKAGFRTREDMGNHQITKMRYSPWQGTVWCYTNENILYCLETPTLDIKISLIGSFDSVLYMGSVPADNKNALIVGNNGPTPLILFPGSREVMGQLVGHTDTVLCISTAFNGRLIATGAKDNSIRLWCYNSVKESRSIDFQCISSATCTEEVSGIGFLINESQTEIALVTISTDDCLNVWQVQCEGQKKATKKLHIPSEKSLLRRLIRGTVKLGQSINHTINDIHTNPKKASVNTSKRRAGGNVFSLASSSGEYIATAGRDKNICVYSWTATRGINLELTLTGHRRPVYCVIFQPTDKGILASGSGDFTVKTWSLYTSGCIQTFQGHTSAVLSIEFISEGLQIVSGDAEGNVRVWRADSGVCVGTIRSATEEKIWALYAMGSGETVFCGGSEGTLECWMDVTLEKSQERNKLRAEKNEKTTQLEACIHSRNYGEGLRRAIELKQPRFLFRFLRLFLAAIMRGAIEDTSDSTKVESLSEILSSLDDQSVITLMGYCTDWMRSSNRCGVAQSCLNTFLCTRAPELLQKINTSQCGVNVGTDVIATMMQRTTKHASRMKRVLRESYIVEYLEFVNSGDTGSFLSIENE